MRRDGPSDKTILRRARQGDRESFLTLLRRYDPRLRRLALRLLADTNRLERVLSRAYIKAWRSLPFVKRSEPAAGWLYRIVYNACINELRWEPPRPAPPPPEGEAVPLPAASAERRLLALRALRPGERVPLVLVDGEGLSLDTAARMMRREPVEVAQDLTRARGQWRALVCGESEPLPEPAVTVELTGVVGGRIDRETEPSLAPSPAATLAKLAALAAPTAPREPGGHVKLLATTPGGHEPPPVAAKPPPTARPEPEPLGATPAPAPTPAEPSSSPAPPSPDDSPDDAKPRRTRISARKPGATRSKAGGKPRRAAGAAGQSSSPATPAEAEVAPTSPDGAAGPSGDGESPAAPKAPGKKRQGAPATDGGAGARRKRRRDAKRAATAKTARSRGGAASEAVAPAPDAAGTAEDRDRDAG